MAGRTAPAPTAAQLDEAEIAARLRLSVTRLARRLRQQADTGYTLSQLSTLASVHNHGPLTLGALAEHERIAPPSITKTVAKLESEGLLERIPDPTDGRVTRVRTTTTGRRLIEESRHRKTTWLTGRIRELDAGDQARLAGALDALDALLAEDRP